MRLKITDRKSANQIVSKPPPDLRAVVSIHTPPTSRLAAFESIIGTSGIGVCDGYEEFEGYKFDLCFDDTENFSSSGVVPPSREGIDSFLRWARRVPFSEEEGTMLIHCHGGISRSTAIAVAVLALNRGPGTEEDCLQEVLRVRPQARPNGVVVDLVDDLLGRGGILSKTVEDWKISQQGKLYIPQE